MVFGEENRSLSSSLCSRLLHARVTSYRIPENPQPVFLPECERPSFTPVQNRHNYSSVYLKPGTRV